MSTNWVNFKLYSKAKLNLRLKVLNKLYSGYHRLSMLNVLCSLSDEVTLEILNETPDTIIQFSEIENKVFANIKESDNLCIRAVKLFLDKNNLNSYINIKIKKNIPVGAGLGGGSSNAGAILLCLAEYFNCWEGLEKIGLSLGADIPFFLKGGSIAAVSGIGEEVLPIECEEIKNWPCLLINPGIHISTKDAFQKFNLVENKEDLEFTTLITSTPLLSVNDIYGLIDNDFLTSFNKNYYSVTQKIANLSLKLGCCYGLSGTGSTFFLVPRSKEFDFSDYDDVIKEYLLGESYKIFFTKICS